MNLYGYVGGMPGVATDPMGLSWWMDLIDAILGTAVDVSAGIGG